MTERFQPGGVTHALVSGMVELALASALLAGSLAASESSPGAAASLAAASLLWAVLGVVSLAMAWLRARVFAAELDDEAVTLHRLGGARRYRYDQLSAVEVSGRRTRLVARDGGARVVRGVRGAAQGNRFRARVLARARAAAGVADGAEGSGSSPRLIACPPSSVRGAAMADGFATRAIHAGRLPLPAEPPLATPIWQTSTFVFDDAEHYAHTLRQPREGYVYTRYENPTTAALEATVADLEGAAEGLATASGMGAIATVLLSLAGAGDHVVAQRDLYGGTHSLLAHTAPRFGIEVSFVDAGDPAAVRAALRPTTRAIYAETVANPTMTVADLPALAEAGAAAPACPWWSTTPWPPPTCAGPSSTGRPLSSTRPPSTWAGTATWSAASPCSPSASATTPPGGP